MKTRQTLKTLKCCFNNGQISLLKAGAKEYILSRGQLQCVLCPIGGDILLAGALWMLIKSSQISDREEKLKIKKKNLVKMRAMWITI